MLLGASYDERGIVFPGRPKKPPLPSYPNRFRFFFFDADARENRMRDPNRLCWACWEEMIAVVTSRVERSGRASFSLLAGI